MVGIIGRNGAGKSTLLKILSRITSPSCGVFRYRGRMASLLEIGTGFHGQLTGRENIFLNGSILGLRRAEIRARLDEIIAFAGIEKSIDTPVRFYSSGMYVRLAFAVAAHLETDILLVDEVLAVGDSEFQKRCTRRMDDVVKGGRTILFVSHNMALIQHHCPRALVLEQGKARFDGPVHDAVRHYLTSQARVEMAQVYPDAYPRKGSGAYRVRAIHFAHAEQGHPLLVCGQRGRIVLEIEADPARLPIRDASISLTFYSLDGVRLTNLWSRAASGDLQIETPRSRIEVEVPKVALRPGEYRLEIWAGGLGEVCDWMEDAGDVEVGEGDFYGTGVMTNPEQGAIFCEHRWGMKTGV